MKSPTMDQLLREIDADSIAAHEPILSALVLDDDTHQPCPIFWESVDKYKLRMPGESDAQVAARLAAEAHAFHRKHQ
jgi:hypothetical protein